MQTIINKTFEDIAPGDAAFVQRTLLASDLRAWASAFGDADVSSGPGQSQGAASIVTGLLGALVGSALPGPGSAIRTTAVQITGSLPIGTPLTTRLVVMGKGPAQGAVTIDNRRAVHRR
jgi:phosphate acetyltransferase